MREREREREEIVCYENHQSDARVKRTDVAMCMGATQNASVANNNPLVVMPSAWTSTTCP